MTTNDVFVLEEEGKSGKEGKEETSATVSKPPVDYVSEHQVGLCVVSAW